MTAQAMRGTPTPILIDRLERRAGRCSAMSMTLRLGVEIMALVGGAVPKAAESTGDIAIADSSPDSCPWPPPTD